MRKITNKAIQLFFLVNTVSGPRDSAPEKSIRGFSLLPKMDSKHFFLIYNVFLNTQLACFTFFFHKTLEPGND